MLNEQELKRITEVYRKPFKYEQEGQIITDSHGHFIIDVRGWGYLQRFTDGENIQDNVGKLVAHLLNTHTL